jgi:hypothetical protein
MDWAHSHAYVPTAIVLADRIRVFVAFWDKHNCGRLGYIDVDKTNPEHVIGHAQTPLVTDSGLGKFDCDGITPLSIVEKAGQLHLYYTGWRNGKTPDEARYYLFVGLMISDDNGDSFQRYQDTPVIGPRTERETMRTGCFVLPMEDEFLGYIATEKGQHTVFGKSLPFYDLEITRSTDGINWQAQQMPLFQHQAGEFLGFGRPHVWRTSDGQFEGLFSLRKWDGTYSDIYYSRSADGINWQPLSLTDKAFSATMTIDQQNEVVFPSLVRLEQGPLAMFYNGDNFGRAGLRLAIWQE